MPSAVAYSFSDFVDDLNEIGETVGTFWQEFHQEGDGEIEEYIQDEIEERINEEFDWDISDIDSIDDVIDIIEYELDQRYDVDIDFQTLWSMSLDDVEFTFIADAQPYWVEVGFMLETPIGDFGHTFLRADYDMETGSIYALIDIPFYLEAWFDYNGVTDTATIHYNDWEVTYQNFNLQLEAEYALPNNAGTIGMYFDLDEQLIGVQYLLPNDYGELLLKYDIDDQDLTGVFTLPNDWGTVAAHYQLGSNIINGYYDIGDEGTVTAEYNLDTDALTLTYSDIILTIDDWVIVITDGTTQVTIDPIDLWGDIEQIVDETITDIEEFIDDTEQNIDDIEQAIENEDYITAGNEVIEIWDGATTTIDEVLNNPNLTNFVDKIEGIWDGCEDIFGDEFA